VLNAIGLRSPAEIVVGVVRRCLGRSGPGHRLSRALSVGRPACLRTVLWEDDQVPASDRALQDELYAERVVIRDGG
jgi:hypothetical protein